MITRYGIDRTSKIWFQRLYYHFSTYILSLRKIEVGIQDMRTEEEQKGDQERRPWSPPPCQYIRPEDRQEARLSCLVLSCLVLSCLVLSCLVLSCLVLSSLVFSCLLLSCLLSCALSCLVLSDTFCKFHLQFVVHDPYFYHRNQMDRNEFKRDLSLSKKSILSKSGRLTSFIAIVHLLSFFFSRMKLVVFVSLPRPRSKLSSISKKKRIKEVRRHLFFLCFIYNHGFGYNPHSHSLQLAEELSIAVLEDKKSLYRQKRQI
jgi:hypothetical protein